MIEPNISTYVRLAVASLMYNLNPVLFIKLIVRKFPERAPFLI